MPPRFGTDGIRGVANSELTPELALSLGRAAARHLPGGPFLIGRDTRLSGPMLQAALSAGLASEGRDVVDLGVLPTPGVAWLAASRRCQAAVISASHNPYRDNGIKLLSAGSKLSLEAEGAVEAELEALCEAVSGPERPAGPVGSLTADEGAADEYLKALLEVASGRPLPDGEVVIDCANGAASQLAPRLFGRLGLAHHVLFAAPNGTNINDGCGSTHLDPLRREVVSRKAAFGIAFDGDADRMLAVDEEGDVVDGDQLIAMFASDLRRAGELAGNAVVVTVMSNLGLRKGLAEAGITIVETPTGDRHVADAIEAGGYVLGGEQSGHIIFRRHAPTGDGLLTAMKLLELLGRSGRGLRALATEAMTRLPQVLLNVSVPDPSRLEDAANIWAETAAVKSELGETGRVLLRSSGTELCVRVMVEAQTHEAAESYAERLAGVVRAELA